MSKFKQFLRLAGVKMYPTRPNNERKKLSRREMIYTRVHISVFGRTLVFICVHDSYAAFIRLFFDLLLGHSLDKLFNINTINLACFCIYSIFIVFAIWYIFLSRISKFVKLSTFSLHNTASNYACKIAA